MKTLTLLLLSSLFMSSCGERAMDDVDDIERHEEVPVDETYRPIPTDIP